MNGERTQHSSGAVESGECVPPGEEREFLMEGCLEQRTRNGILKNMALIPMQLQVRLLSTYYVLVLRAAHMASFDICSIIVR